MLVLARSNDVINDRLKAELADVEARFTAEVLSDLDCVNSLVAHVERFRGKMLRPTLVLVTAMAVDPQQKASRDAHRVLATVVEMVHMATLVHDDILDEAKMRRRGATINHLASNEAAVMLGDYLISHAYHLCSSLGDSNVSRQIADATNVVCEGELLQLANRNNWQLDEQTYYEIIRRKTASLCGVCCKVAAMLSDTSPDLAAAMYEYGEKLGIAFQIVDDLLDVTGDEKTVGKSLGRDLEKGKLTLPLIRYRTICNDADRQAMLSLLENASHGGSAEVDHDAIAQQVRQRLIGSQAVAYAQKKAAELVEQAKSAVLDHLQESPARTLMLDMADAVLTRQF